MCTRLYLVLAVAMQLKRFLHSHFFPRRLVQLLILFIIAQTLIRYLWEKMENAINDEILCKFGIITDLQYADVDNGANFAKTRIRYHRDSLTQLKSAVTEWNRTKADFALDLGDLLDGKSAKYNQSEKNLSKTLRIYQDFDKPVYFQWGNHFFYNFKRTELFNMHHFNPHLFPSLHTSHDKTAIYYHFSPCKGFRIVVLDVYEISMLGRSEQDPVYQEAETILRSKNKNKDLNSQDGLQGEDVRYLKFNGAVTDKQLEWLDSVLKHCHEHGENVLVTGHTPVFAPSSDIHCVPWNYKSILDVLQRHSCVAAYFAGHDHNGGYAVDPAGIHHITFQGAVETPPGIDTFAVVYVHPNKLEVKGYGRVKSVHIPFSRELSL